MLCRCNAEAGVDTGGPEAARRTVPLFDLASAGGRPGISDTRRGRPPDALSNTPAQRSAGPPPEDRLIVAFRTKLERCVVVHNQPR